MAGFVASPAFATGTAAGTVITNTVTVDYEVGGINQADATASNDVTVDRKVNVTVARVDGTATSVTPGAANQAVSFIVENVSNDTLDFELTSLQVTSGNPAGISGNDGFDVTAPLAYYLDDGDNAFDGGDTAITHLDALAPDSPVTVHVVAASVPTGLADGAIAALTLTATAKENDNGAALGSNLTQAATNTVGEDTIFADAAGATDGARDAAFSATDDYVVLTATLTATKSSRVIAGAFGTGAAIPGATVEYCITVTNSGSADATSVSISDDLPTEMTFADGVWVGGADCDTRGADTGGESGGTVTGTIATLAAGTSQTLIFEATIN